MAYTESFHPLGTEKHEMWQKTKCEQQNTQRKNPPSKHITIIIAVITAFALICTLYACGFRITYAPKLENNWDAISACASWASVIMSFIAILFAIWVPIRIQKRQEKITLFEQRLKCFNVVCEIGKLAHTLSVTQPNTKCVNTIFANWTVSQGGTMDAPELVTVYLENAFDVLKTGQWLFPNYGYKTILGIISELASIFYGVHKSENRALTAKEIDSIKVLKQLTIDYSNNYLDGLMNTLNLSDL